MKIFGVLCLALILCIADTQVIGIDFGTEFWKASLISPGKNLVIVENSRSDRKSYNGVTLLLFRSLSWMESGTSSTTPS
jgi:molecular chaperone DnaK (HSP70)